MKVLVCLLFLFCLLFLPTSAFAVTLFSTDFESGNISSWMSSGGGAIATVSAEFARSGQYSLKVSHDKTSSYGYQTTIQNIEGGMFYQVSGFGKSSDSSIASLFIRVAWYASADGSGTQLASPNDTDSIGAGNDWTNFSSGIIQAPSTANSAKVRLVLTSKTVGQTASAFFDDVFFQESVAPTAVTTTNPPTQTLTTTPTKTLTPTKTIEPTVTTSLISTATYSAQDILGESSVAAEEKITKSPTNVKVLASRFSKLPILFVFFGGLISLVCGILLYFKVRREISSFTQEDEE